MEKFILSQKLLSGQESPCNIKAMKPQKNQQINVVYRTSSSETEIKNQHQQDQCAGKKIIIRKYNNFFQRIEKVIPDCHVYNFMDQICINQATIRNSENEESVMRTLFYFCSIERVEVNSAYVKLRLKSDSSSSNIPYVIDRFNSFGDTYFHYVAECLQTLRTNLLEYLPIKINENKGNQPQLKTHIKKLTDQFLQSIKGRPYFVKILPNQYIFSKEFLEMIGRDDQTFIHQCMRYKVLLEDFFTAENYRFLLEQTLKYNSYYVQYLMGNISLEKVIEASRHQYTTFLKGNNKKIRVRINGFMPNPFIFCMLVEQIYHSQNIVLPASKDPMNNLKRQFDESHLKEKEDLIGKIHDMGQKDQKKSLLERCSFMMKPKKRKRKMSFDYQG